MDNKINFTSTINIVTGREFEKVAKKCHVNIPYEPYETGKFNVAAHSFQTGDIRTCTAGGLTDTQDFALGFHLIDSFNNNEHMNEITDIIKSKLPDRPLHGLLIGSKNFVWCNISPEIFAKMKNFMNSVTKNLTLFEEHADSAGESHIHYCLFNDTWTINSKLFDRKKELYYDVQTPYDLLKAYKNIYIADGDILMINGRKIEL